MRKFFGGHSLEGVAIIVFVFFLAIYFRFVDLSGLSPWHDELATWWYTGRLGDVFLEETHSPVYYGVLRLFFGTDPSILNLRTFSAALSLLHLIEMFFLGQLVFQKRAFLVFWILICLSPVDIIYSRMARHYSWYLEGIIVYYFLWKWNGRPWLKYLTGAFMPFIHVFSLAPIWTMSLWKFFKDRGKKDFVFSILSSSIVLIYYLFKYYHLGNQRFLENVSWNIADTNEFLVLLLTQFFGESSPRYFFYPLNPVIAGVLFISVFSFIIWRKKESGRILILLLLGTIIGVSVLSYWNNFRVNRYFIYLVSFWILAISESWESENLTGPVVILFLSIALIGWVGPLRYYPWDAENVEVWKEFKKKHSPAQELVCAHPFESAFYKLNAAEDCEKKYAEIRGLGPILYFNIRGTTPPFFKDIMAQMKPTDSLVSNRALMVRFDSR